MAIDQAAALLHQRFQLLSHRPLIKARAALLSDAPQGGRQQRLPQDLASAIGLSAALVIDGFGAGIGLQQGGRPLERIRQHRIHRKALLSQANRWSHHLRAAQSAKTLLGLQQAGHCSRHPRAQQAAGGQLPIDAAISTKEQIFVGAARRHLAEIERITAALRLVPKHQKTTAAQIAGLRQRHRQGVGRGHSGIDGIAALGEDRSAGGTCQGLLAGDDSSL